MDSKSTDQNDFSTSNIDEDDPDFWSQQAIATNTNFGTGWQFSQPHEAPTWPGQYNQDLPVSAASNTLGLFGPSLDSSLDPGDSNLEDPDWWKQWDDMELPDISSTNPDQLTPNPFGSMSQGYLFDTSASINSPTTPQCSSYQPLDQNLQAQYASWGGQVVMQPIDGRSIAQSTSGPQFSNYQPLDRNLQTQYSSWGSQVVMQPTAEMLTAHPSTSSPISPGNSLRPKRRDSAFLRTSNYPTLSHQKRDALSNSTTSPTTHSHAVSSTTSTGIQKSKPPHSHPHSTTEQKYRKGLNDRFATLLDALPPEIVSPTASGKAEEKAITKIEVLDLAKKQIDNLEKEVEDLEGEGNVLKAQLELFERLMGGAGGGFAGGDGGGLGGVT